MVSFVFNSKKKTKFFNNKRELFNKKKTIQKDSKKEPLVKDSFFVLRQGRDTKSNKKCFLPFVFNSKKKGIRRRKGYLFFLFYLNKKKDNKERLYKEEETKG